MLLTACSSKIPEGMSKDAYEYGCKALQILKDCNDGKVSSDDAFDRLTAISKTISDMDSYSEYPKDSVLQTEVFLASLAVSSYRDYNSYDEQKKLEKILEK